jgi:hypothetical protein
MAIRQATADSKREGRRAMIEGDLNAIDAGAAVRYPAPEAWTGGALKRPRAAFDPQARRRRPIAFSGWSSYVLGKSARGQRP